MVSRIIVIAVGSFLALALATGFTEIFVEENQKHNKPTGRVMSYFLCVVFVFVASILWGAIVASPIYPGAEGPTGGVATEYQPGMSLAERDKTIQNTFLVTVLPALIGVRLALGRKPKS